MTKCAKTNAMRALDRANAAYTTRTWEAHEAMGGMDVAALLHADPGRVFKTLVTVGKSGLHYVFMVPVCEELDLKKAANSVNEKSVTMVRSKDLLELTGYVHGCCSPLGMKRAFTTTIDETATLYDTILFSGGKFGCQIEVGLNDLKKAKPVDIADLTRVPS